MIVKKCMNDKMVCRDDETHHLTSYKKCDYNEAAV